MERRFKGLWMPVELLDCRGLNAIEKLALAEIDSLDTSERGCYASNPYLSEFLGVQVRQVTRIIAKLKDYQLITTGRQLHPSGKFEERIIRSNLDKWVAAGGVLVKNVQDPPSQKCPTEYTSTLEVNRTTRQAATRPAKSDGQKGSYPASGGRHLGRYQQAKIIANKAGLPLSEKGAAIENKVLENQLGLADLLTAIYNVFSCYSYESVNGCITSAVEWLVRSKAGKGPKRKDQVLFILDWLQTAEAEKIVTPADDTKLVYEDSRPSMPDFRRVEYARFLAGLWNPKILSI